MATTKKSIKANRTQLFKSLKKTGLSFWRFVFTGNEVGSGTERVFFVELSFLNPALSPSEPVLGFKNRSKISEDDLQNVLAGTSSAQKLKSETFVPPSYVAVKAGCFGQGAKQVAEYTNIKNVKIDSKLFGVSLASCLFTEDRISGHIDCSPGELQEHPEYLCSSGNMSWELHYEIRKDLEASYRTKDFEWTPFGLRVVFAGKVLLDGREYEVIPKKCFGYIDRSYGKISNFPWYHLSSSNLTSIITGKTLENCSFSAQGVYNGKTNIFLEIEGKTLEFLATKKRAYESTQEFIQSPDSNTEGPLHWILSVHNRKYIIDIDVFCPANQMFVRQSELPEGERRCLNTLAGGTGYGEIRLYKRIFRNLELIEHAKINTCFCEYGVLDAPNQEN